MAIVKYLWSHMTVVVFLAFGKHIF